MDALNQLLDKRMQPADSSTGAAAQNGKNTWIIDSGASSHMTGNYLLFDSYSKTDEPHFVTIADGTNSRVEGIGTVKLNDKITLNNVLFVPKLSCNLFSVSQFCKKEKCTANFSENYCEFQGLESLEKIDSAKKMKGLYFFEGHSRQTDRGLGVSVDDKCNKIKLLHLRLGHPNFVYLKKLYPTLFLGIRSEFLKCEFCEISKHTRSSYKPVSYKESVPFHLIHSDVWGPSKNPNLTHNRWFVTFIDDHTRVCWVYLMKQKSDVSEIFERFYKMVETQFQTKIQILRSDNGTEYLNSCLGPFLTEKGIVHQTSCTNTPQQNGVAERKNRHLLEVTRTLLFSYNVPSHYWGEAVLTAAFLLNRMPSRILSFKTPIENLTKYYPHTKLVNNIPLKIFGCTAFVHIHSQNRSKIGPRAVKTIFIGYSSTQKGFKCFDPKTRKFYISYDVTFFENQPFFNKDSNTSLEHYDFLNNECSLPVVTPDFIPETQLPQSVKSIAEPDKQIIVYTRQKKSSKTLSTANPPQDTVCLPLQETQQCTSEEEQPNQTAEPTGMRSPELEQAETTTAENTELKQTGNISPISSVEDLPIALRKSTRTCTYHPIDRLCPMGKYLHITGLTLLI
jgi:hypothetical protein